MAATSPELIQQFAAALAHHQAGRLAEAERLYRRICETDPRHFEALHYLGVLAGQMGRIDMASEWLNAAPARVISALSEGRKRNRAPGIPPRPPL